MPFGFGGSSSTSSSQNQSQGSSFDVNDASSFNFGQSGSASGGQSGSQDTVAFADLFAQLFGGSSGAAGAVNTGGITNAANQLFGSGSDFLSGLGGGAGSQFLQDRLAGSDQLVDSQISQLSGDIGEFLSETVNPAITSGGVSAGTLGGSRGEVQRGLASEAALEEFTRGSTQIRSDERAATSQIAQFLSGQESQNSQIGLNALPGLFGLAEGGAMAGLSPFLALAQIFGGPTTLGSSQSSQFGSSFGFDAGGSQQTGRAGSQSTSSGSSTSSSGSFDIGF